MQYTNRTIKKICFLIYLSELLSLIVFILFNEKYDIANFRGYCLFSVIFCPLQIFFLLITTRMSVLSFPSVYLLVTYLFTNSAFILYLFLGSFGLSTLRLVNYEYLSMSVPLVAMTFVSFSLGTLISKTSKQITKKSIASNFFQIYNSQNRLHEYYLSIICIFIILFCLGFIGFLYLQGKGLAVMIQGGYHEFARIEKNDFSQKFLVASLTWLIPWSTLILLALSSRSIKSLRRSFIWTFICCALLLLSGDRGTALPILLIYIQSYSISVSKFNWLRWSLILIFIFLLVPLVQVLRAIPVSQWNFGLLQDIILNSDKYFSTYIQAFFEPFSSSIQTFMGTLMQINSMEDYRWGMDYLRSILSAIPFNSRTAPSNGEWVKEYISPNTIAGTGFLAIAEAYLNFSWVGIIVIFTILGSLTGKYWVVLRNKMLTTIDLSMILIVFYSMTIWVRNEFSMVCRTILWSWFLIYISPKILSYFLGKKSVKFF